MAAKSDDFQRRRPRQARSRATYDSILEALAQVLARDGAQGLTTNRVAERAGVSIGTLYQYFPDKAAIVLAAARRELAAPGFLSQPKALMEALVAILEGLLGGQAQPVRAGARTRAPTRRRPGPALERRLAGWLWAMAPQPA